MSPSEKAQIELDKEEEKKERNRIHCRGYDRARRKALLEGKSDVDQLNLSICVLDSSLLLVVLELLFVRILAFVA